jgi:hypothetical protein
MILYRLVTVVDSLYQYFRIAHVIFHIHAVSGDRSITFLN